MFTGFSDATIDFLWELRFHNERPWFLEHKQTFLDTLDRPMKALADEVYVAFTDRRCNRRTRAGIPAAEVVSARGAHLPRRAAAARQRTIQGEPLVHAALRQQPRAGDPCVLL